MEVFRKCPRCDSYMTSYMIHTFDGGRVEYSCSCGYSSKIEYNKIRTSNKSIPNSSGAYDSCFTTKSLNNERK